MGYTNEQLFELRAALSHELGEQFEGMGVRMKNVSGRDGLKLQIQTRWDFNDEVNGKIDVIGKRVLGDRFNRASDIDYVHERPTRPGPEYVR